MENISSEIRDKAHQVCCDYLGGVWQKILPDEMILEKLSGGYANLTLKLSLPPNYNPIEEEPTQIIMKINLNVLGEGYFRQVTENIIAVSLAEKNLTPRVYAIFDGGRLDEYIISRPLVKQDLHNSNIISAIARKLAHLHSMTLPISKDPNKLYNLSTVFIHKALNDPRNNEDDPKRKTVMDNFISMDPYKELKWLKQIIDSLGSPVVFCHGDLQLNNMLLEVNTTGDSIIHLVDLDTCGYNCRGIDFAGITNSFCLEVPYSEPPYIKFHWDQCATLEEQKYIFTVYLEEFQKVNNITLDPEKEIDMLLKETKVFTLMGFFVFFSSILVKKENTNTNKIDWLELANILINRYKELKQAMILAD